MTKKKAVVRQPKPPLRVQPSPGPLRYNLIRYGLRFFVGCYLRVRVENEHLLPRGEPYLICFSHPNWIDPMVLVAYWPDRRYMYVFGPREADMGIEPLWFLSDCLLQTRNRRDILLLPVIHDAAHHGCRILGVRVRLAGQDRTKVVVGRREPLRLGAGETAVQA